MGIRSTFVSTASTFCGLNPAKPNCWAVSNSSSPIHTKYNARAGAKSFSNLGNSPKYVLWCLGKQSIFSINPLQLFWLILFGLAMGKYKS